MCIFKEAGILYAQKSTGHSFGFQSVCEQISHDEGWNGTEVKENVFALQVVLKDMSFENTSIYHDAET